MWVLGFDISDLFDYPDYQGSHQIDPNFGPRPIIAEPAMCPPNSFYSSSRAPCPTCQRRNARSCLGLISSGCFCTPPYIQFDDDNSINIKCILKRECPEPLHM